MATRHHARAAVISLLYAKEIGGETGGFVEEFLEERRIRNEQKNWTLALLRGVEANLGAIDAAINEHLSEYKLSELAAVERAILRLGTYELKFSDTDPIVVINEAVESTKELGSSPKLVNGVLDALKKSLVEKPALSDATDKSKIAKALDDAAKDSSRAADNVAASAQDKAAEAGSCETARGAVDMSSCTEAHSDTARSEAENKALHAATSSATHDKSKKSSRAAASAREPRGQNRSDDMPSIKKFRRSGAKPLAQNTAAAGKKRAMHKPAASSKKSAPQKLASGESAAFKKSTSGNITRKKPASGKDVSIKKESADRNFKASKNAAPKKSAAGKNTAPKSSARRKISTAPKKSAGGRGAVSKRPAGSKDTVRGKDKQ